MKIFIATLIIISFSSKLYSQANCFENCWRSFDKSNVPIHEIINQNNEILKQLVGCKVPDFAVKSISGEEFSIQKLKGKIIVINFWFTTCAPCITELPALNKLVDEYFKKDVVFIAFGRDDKVEILDFMKKHKFDYNQISSDYNLTKKYCVLSGWPMNLVIDREGILRYIKSGGPVAGQEKEFIPYNEMKPVIEEYINK